MQVKRGNERRVMRSGQRMRPPSITRNTLSPLPFGCKPPGFSVSSLTPTAAPG